MIEALQQSHLKLTNQVRRLELEQAKHLAMIARLKESVPQHILRQLETIDTSAEARSKNGVLV